MVSCQLLCIFCVSTYAAPTLTVTAAYDSAQGKVTVIGEAPPNSAISLIIIPDAASVASINDSNPPVDGTLFSASDDGSYTKSLNLDITLQSGKYKIFLNAMGIEASATFMHVNEQQVQAVLPAINSASNAAALAAVISQNATALGIDQAIISSYLSRISVLLDAWNRSFNTAVSFSSSFNEALACIYINDGIISDTLLKYASDCKIDYQNDYSALTSAEKTKLDALLKGTNFSASPISEAYPKTSVLAQVQASDRWSALQTIVLNNASTIGISLGAGSRYSLVNNKDAVFERMFLSTFTTFDNIAAAFVNAVEFVITNQNSSGNGGGNANLPGSNGSGGGGMSVGSSAASQITPDELSANNQSNIIDFPDTKNYWASEQINELVSRSIINGFPDGTFKPDAAITRAEFSKILVSAFKIIPVSGEGFSDVTPTDWFSPYVYAAFKENIVTGYDNNFAPLENITRQDAAVMIYRYLSSRGLAPSGEKSFTDSDFIADYAKTAVSSLASGQLLNGSNGMFNPNNNTTRAEAATMIYNILTYEELNKN